MSHSNLLLSLFLIIRVILDKIFILFQFHTCELIFAKIQTFKNTFTGESQSHRYLINRIDQTSRSQCFEATGPVNKWSGS